MPITPLDDLTTLLDGNGTPTDDDSPTFCDGIISLLSGSGTPVDGLTVTPVDGLTTILPPLPGAGDDASSSILRRGFAAWKLVTPEKPATPAAGRPKAACVPMVHDAADSGTDDEALILILAKLL